MISGSVLALQVVITRIFSIVIWHHFTYLVIGVALLGGGAAGTFLTVKRWTPEQVRDSLGVIAALFSLAILVNLLTIASIRIDPLQLDRIGWTLGALCVHFAALFSTFFLGGLAVAGCFSVWVHDVHRLYFTDLIGAGASTVVVLWVLQAVGGPGALVFIAWLCMVAALLFGGRRLYAWRRTIVAGAAAQALLLGWVVTTDSITLPIPESKDLGWAMGAYNLARPELTVWNPVARVDVLPEVRVSEPMIVGGVSSTWLDTRQPADGSYGVRLVTLDGTSMTGLYAFDGNLEPFDFLKHTVIAAAFQLGIDRPSVLNIGVGGGLDILLALVHGASPITAIELNADVVGLLTGRYADYGGRLAYRPDTEVIVAEGRSFLIRDGRRFDLVQGIGLDNIAALNGGAYILAESYLYTVESFELAIDRLTERGVFSWTRGAGTPPREMLRLVGLAAEALRRRGVSSPARHIAVVGNESEGIATLLVGQSPFTVEAMAGLRTWAAAKRFPMLFDPFERRPTAYADYLLADDPRAFEQGYRFNISPVTDDNPFFYNYFRFSDWRFNRADTERLYRFPMGNLILVTIVTLSCASAIAFILLPLWFYHRAGLETPHAVPMLTYFGMLGLGYICVEIILIQRFTLLIGYPTLAVTTSLFSMLVFSAIGSLLGRHVSWTVPRIRVLAFGIAVAIAAYAVSLPAAVNAMLHLSSTARIAAGVALAAPLALALGLPFPSGLSRIGMRAPGLVPWAWGINGVLSVVGSSVVILVSMVSSFTVAMLLTAVPYLIATLVAGALDRVALESTTST